MPMLQERFRIQLDLACWRIESTSIAIGHRGKFAMAGFEWNADTAWCCAQTLERHAAWGELMPVSGIDIAFPELMAEPETSREVEDDLDIRSVPPHGATTRFRS